MTASLAAGEARSAYRGRVRENCGFPHPDEGLDAKPKINMNNENNTSTPPGLTQPGSTSPTRLYEVEVHRTEYRAATVFDLADSEQQSEETAEGIVGTDQFKTVDADQYVNSASLVPAELAKSIQPTATDEAPAELHDEQTATARAKLERREIIGWPET